MFKKLFKKNKPEEPEDDYDEAAEQAWYERKSAYLESLLGKEHDMVMHALIPFAFGGGLDLYYYPNGIPGTGIATKELVDLEGRGPSNRLYPAYELVMFTKHPLDLGQAKDPTTPFGAAHHNINAVLNLIARYSAEAVLNPGDTCEFPQEMEKVGGKCFIFDAYAPPDDLGPREMGLLLILEVFRSEMNVAMEEGSGGVLQLLKEAGHYPYSDLDRPPVV